MRKPFYIYSCSNFHHSVEGVLPLLKATVQKLCGKKIRRIDRFTQLALIGSLQCKADFELPDKTGIYLASKYGPLNNTSDVLGQIYQNGQLPKPINFINTVSNTACFYLAEQLDLSACNQFVTSEDFTLAASLNLSSLDLEAGRVVAALVGLVCEVDKNLSFHRKRISLGKDDCLTEGSHWLMVAYDLAGKKPLAKIHTIAQPINEHDMDSLLIGFATKSKDPISVCFSKTIAAEKRGEILAKNTFIEKNYAPPGMQHEYPEAFQLHGFLEQTQHDQLVYIDKNKNGLYSVINIELLS